MRYLQKSMTRRSLLDLYLEIMMPILMIFSIYSYWVLCFLISFFAIYSQNWLDHRNRLFWTMQLWSLTTQIYETVHTYIGVSSQLIPRFVFHFCSSFHFINCCFITQLDFHLLVHFGMWKEALPVIEGHSRDFAGIRQNSNIDNIGCEKRIGETYLVILFAAFSFNKFHFHFFLMHYEYD